LFDADYQKVVDKPISIIREFLYPKVEGFDTGDAFKKAIRERDHKLKMLLKKISDKISSMDTIAVLDKDGKPVEGIDK
jgi:hypothetical protein